eukprot:TRINITY_DN33191_c0_g1_i10.p1 TRINITY_DN33191_c0_g1~~TRINITY_DN33191_c0_g1_i10.p1  ORF type:complete len:310 (+),score=28.58 TRINITY_DN33191_c0_g1_i10:241-1170(+)
MIVAVRLGAPTGDVAALSSVNTVFAALLGRVFLGEPLQLSHCVSVLCCMTGGVLISKPVFIFGNPSSVVPIAAYLSAVAAGFFSACIAISARKAGGSSPWFLNMCASTTGSVVFALLPMTPLLDDPEFSISQHNVGEGALFIAANFVLFVVGIGVTTGGAMLCPAAVTATVNVSARITLGYMADVLIFGGSIDPLSLCGAALMLGAVLVMACARKPAAEVEEESPKSADSSPAATRLSDAEPAAADDETNSLASFIATEFVAERGYQSSVRHRRQTGADESGLSPVGVMDRTVYGNPAVVPSGAALAHT